MDHHSEEKRINDGMSNAMGSSLEASYLSAVDYIYSIPRFAKKGGIEQTRSLMALIGNPQNDFRYIHVAGTNGKGSVCAFLDAALRRFGLRTGLFTSPHLVRINERIRVDGEMIPDADFTELFDEIKAKVDIFVAGGGAHPTFFEWMYMMAMLWFKRQGVCWAVVETGLGGRLDATNVIEAPELTVITSIGYDHMQYLGSTLTEIATEKAGIIKRGVPLVFDAGKDEASAVIIRHFHEVQGECDDSCPEMLGGSRQGQCGEPTALPGGLRTEKQEMARTGAICVPVDISMARHIDYPRDAITYDLLIDGISLHMHLRMLGTYQVPNSLLALQALRVLGLRHDYFGLDKVSYYRNIGEAFCETVWPGRMEKITDHLYIDGAHNEEGIRALVQTIETRFAGQEIYLLFAAAEDKDYTGMIRSLCKMPGLRGVMVTSIESGRQLDTETAAALFEGNGHMEVRQSRHIKDALREALRWCGSHILCCCGSLYLAGSIKEMLPLPL